MPIPVQFIGKRKSRFDHTGAKYGAMEVTGVASADAFGPLVYAVRWICCGREVTIGQSTMNRRKYEPLARCKACYDAGREVRREDPPGSVRVPTWGLVFPITGPMGPRFGIVNTQDKTLRGRSALSQGSEF
jgi:hypothetical protein